MWECTPQLLEGGRARRYVPRRGGAPVSYRDVMRGWRDDGAFRWFFNALLAGAPYAGFRWETPPVTAASADRAFEFVLLDAPGLDRTPDPHAFDEQFRAPGGDGQVIAFPNLAKDALLVVPRPSGPAEAYVHLALFVRHAPAAQVDELWQVVGATLEARLSAAPTWLSTAGMGVSWLHVRLDARPKYYGFAPYRGMA